MAKFFVSLASCLFAQTPTIACVFLFSTISLSSANALATENTPDHLTCEWQPRPVGVDRKSPRLSWHANTKRQSAYQIQAASSLEILQDSRADLWDSGKVDHSASVCVPYAGGDLASRQQVFWRVRVWPEDSDAQNADNRSPGPWSKPARWEMGLLHPSDWTARWIKPASPRTHPDNPALQHWYQLSAYGDPSDDEGAKKRASNQKRLQDVVPATRLKKSFTVSRPVAAARMYSTAAGYAEFFLDGQKIGPRVMNPAQTDFDKRILYDVDVLDNKLVVGDHVLTAHLGQGFYGQNVGFGTKFDYGDPQILVQLEIQYQDGTTDTIHSDATWLTQPSEVIKNNVYSGQVLDARRITPLGSDSNTDSANWVSAVVSTDAPTQSLRSQMLPPIQLVRDVAAVRVIQPDPGAFVFDFGQNFTGVPTLDLSNYELPGGTAVFLRYAEWADAEGVIHTDSDGAFATGVHQVDAYITADGVPAKFQPSFTWHGFRYIEVTGMPPGAKSPTSDWVKSDLDKTVLTGHLARSNVATRGTFRCSDDHLNRIHQTAVWTYESNLMSLPSDCPIRERCGWTGDAHATVTMSNFNFDMAGLWEKYLEDFQTNKAISPMIVPGRRTANSHPDWAVAQVLIAWERYLFDADRETVRQHYPRLKRFMTHFESLRKADGVVRAGYGDWCDPVRSPGQSRIGGRGTPQQTRPAITSTGLLVYAADLMRQMALALDQKQDAEYYQKLYLDTKETFHRVFFRPARNSYGSQTADAMALSFGIVPNAKTAQVAASLNQDVIKNWNGHASVGALGHRWLYPALADHGYSETALGTFFAGGFPGFSYLFDTLNGTTLWERKGAFDPSTMDAPQRSLSHPFQGGYDAWFFQGLGGVRPDPSTPGYQHFVLAPSFVQRLDWVKVDLHSRYGLIQSHWSRTDDGVQWNVTVPPNTTATVRLPGKQIDGQTLQPGTHKLSVSSR